MWVSPGQAACGAETTCIANRAGGAEAVGMAGGGVETLGGWLGGTTCVVTLSEPPT